MYVHGGRGRSGTRNDDSAVNIAKWAETGYFTMTVEYRLVGGSPAPAPYEDMLCAIRWLHAHAAEYNVDPDRIYLIGFSSGGHLATPAASLGDGPFKRVGGWENARTDVRAVISTGGAYDLNTLSWGNLWTPLTGDVTQSRTLASPLHQVTPKSRPMMIAALRRRQVGADSAGRRHGQGARGRQGAVPFPALQRSRSHGRNPGSAGRSACVHCAGRKRLAIEPLNRTIGAAPLGAHTGHARSVGEATRMSVMRLEDR
jgi:hypothetical protein